jgi:hypothetical protein
VVIIRASIVEPDRCRRRIFDKGTKCPDVSNMTKLNICDTGNSKNAQVFFAKKRFFMIVNT